MAKEIHFLYALIKKNKPVYVGVSSNIRNRIKQHKRNGKDFDKYVIIKRFDDKKKAFIAENSIILFNSLFDLGLTNMKFLTYEYYNKFELNGGMD